MNKKRDLYISTLLVIFIVFIVVPLLLFYSCFKNPPMPKITSGEFSFRLEYEVNGERMLIEDTLICKYYIQLDEAHGKSVRLKTEWKNDKNKYYKHTLHKIDDIMLIQYSAPQARYWMGEVTADYDLTIPEIDLVNTQTWHREKLTAEEWLQNYGFRILCYQCDPPIQNTFK